ncbi:MAG: hypothetical protein WC455_12190 [Dehalococcoidia bacterium]|jgi:hypothetical protein
MKRTLLILIAVLMVGPVMGQYTDRTPYRVVCGGNGYDGAWSSGGWTWEEFCEKYDGNLAGDAGFLKYVFDSAGIYKPALRNYLGPYCGPHEVALYNRDHPEYQYAQRLTDEVNNWYYVYMKHYMDSIGVSPESLVVHILDTAYSVWVKSDAITRTVSNANALNYSERRQTHQYFNNTSGDTAFYPAGYCWTLNGRCSYTIEAVRYAYSRHMIEDSATDGIGPIGGHWTAGFYDNYQEYDLPLYGYWTPSAYSGGPTAGFDWYECHNITNADSAWKFKAGSFDHAAAEIDRELGPHGYIGVANAPLGNNCQRNLGRLIDSVRGVSFEGYIDYTKRWSTWKQIYAMAETCAVHPAVVDGWVGFCDFLSSTDPANWRHDSARVYGVQYGMFLTFMDTNSCFTPLRRFNHPESWAALFENNFGAPCGRPEFIDTNNAASPIGDYDDDADVLVRRSFDSGNVYVYVRTAGPSSNFTTDSMKVSLTGSWYLLNYTMSGSAFGSTPVDSFWIKPYQCVIVANEPGFTTPKKTTATGLIGAPNYEVTYPEIYRTPSTFTFAGTEGGANPASQSLNISNSGIGSLVWTVSEDSSWLLLSPGSGINTGTVTVSCNISGLPVGTRTAYISIAATGASNTPQTCLVSLTISAAPVEGDVVGNKKVRTRL